VITSDRRAGDPLATILDRIAGRGISVQPWLSTVQGQGSGDGDPPRPTLYLVEPGAPPPPTWGEVEDWVRLPLDLDELQARADRLHERAWVAGAVATEVDDDGILRVDRHLVILSPLEARLVRLLLARRGEVVGRDEAEASMWPDGPPDDQRAMDNRVKHLRRRLADLPLRIWTVRGRGYLIDWDADAAAARGRPPLR
jgi:DNA-binding winged helix-turn-helix (wHTH) protein